MKKTIFTGLGIALPMLAINLISYGQANNSGLRFSENISSAKNSVSKNDVRILHRGEVNSKAVKGFVRSYKNVSDEKWYEVPGVLIAEFTRYGIDYRIDYDKKGNWLHTMRTYDESKMQEDLRQTVKSNYYDYEINLVHEIESPVGPVTYVVQLVGKTKVINLRLFDGEMEEWQKFDNYQNKK